MASSSETQGQGLPLLALAGLCVMVAMRMCDAMLPALAASFDIASAEASPVISSFAVAYGVMQLLSGPLGDRYGKPRIITLATLACAMSAFGAAVAQDLSWLIFARAVMGARHPR